MEISTKDFVWHANSHGHESAPPLVLLHGFAQSQNSFAELAPLLKQKYRVISIDLPGHGKTVWNGTDEIAWPMLCLNLLDAIAQIDSRPAHWFGYSQGGRVALMCALSNPERVKSLALLGASTGIADSMARTLRRESDHVLGQNIVNRGLEWFANYWEGLPIFATQKHLPENSQRLIRSERMACTAKGLQLALDTYGTGTMPVRFEQLAKWRKPLMLAAGEFDTKFAESNQRVAGASSSRLLRQHVIKRCGHAAHLEQPEQFVILLSNFIHAAEGLVR